MNSISTSLSTHQQALLLDVHALLMTENAHRDVLLQRLCELLQASLAFPLVWAGLLNDGGELETLAAAGAEAGAEGEGRTAVGSVIRHIGGLRGEPLALRCVRTGQAVFSERAQSELPFPLVSGSALYLPFKRDDEVQGVLCLGAPCGHLFPETEQILLDLVARHTGFALAMLARFSAANRAEERLKLAAAVFDHALEGIFITDAQGRILAANPAVCRITGYDTAELIGQTPRLFRSERHDQAFYEAFWQGLETQGFWQGEIWNRRRNGEEFPEMLSVSAIRDDAGRPVQYVSLLVDISAQKEVEARLAHRAHHDDLTGLPNRAMFKEFLTHALARAHREQHTMALLYLDVDHFKYINDTLGHHEGDTLLRAVATRLLACLRKDDVVARLGGDEFAVALCEITHMQDASLVAGKILDAMAEPLHLAGQEVSISVSVGISLFPDDGEGLDALLRNADNAMYHAKEKGRNGIQFYRPEMSARSSERLALGSALKKALERNEFSLAYQPLIAADDGRCVGVEVLLRWHGAEGVVSPARFIPVAEETGDIVDIGAWVLRTACIQGQAWRAQGLDGLKLAVNLSARQLRERGLIAMVGTALEHTGFPPGSLEIEITESVAMQSVDNTGPILSALKEMGVRLSIDDFGTGYSSLAYLGQYPLDVLKLDASFVQRIGGDGRYEAIVRAVIAMAGNLDLSLVAEGVETSAQKDFLQRNGCDILQGYYLGHPMPAAEFEKWLANWQGWLRHDPGTTGPTPVTVMAVQHL